MTKNTTKNTMKEHFLKEFFLIDGIVAELLSEKDRYELFEALADVFLLEERDVRELYLVGSQPHFRDMRELSDYERMSRRIEYAQLIGKPMQPTEAERLTLCAKRGALTDKERIVDGAKNLTAHGTLELLREAAASGKVAAMTTLAYLELTGLISEPDTAAAVRRVYAAARWNSVFACMLGLKHNRAECDFYASKLFCLGYRDAAEAARARYKARVIEDTLTPLIERAIARGALKRDVYDREAARLVYSDMISLDEKKKLIASRSRELGELIAGIPFGAVRGAPVCSVDRLREIPLCREEELRRVARSVNVIASCDRAAYTPLMISCCDPFTADVYRRALERVFDGCVSVDASTLTPPDVSHTAESFVLRGIARTGRSSTVFLIHNAESASEAGQAALAELLDYGTREHFALTTPRTVIDISDAVFILISNSQSDVQRSIAPLCECVNAERITSEEKEMIVGELLRRRAGVFGRIIPPLDAECREYLASLDGSDMLFVIDTLLKNIVGGTADGVTLKALKEARGELDRPALARYGFGFTAAS